MRFQSQNEWITLPKIRLIDERNVTSNASYYLSGERSLILTEKIANNQFVKFCLNSVNENNIRIITVQPQYVLCNFSKYHLSFHAFCIHRNEKISYNDVVRLLTERSKSVSIVDNISTVDNT